MFDNELIGQSLRIGETYESHHTVGQVLSQAFGFNLTAQEGLCLTAYLLVSVTYMIMNVVALLRPVSNLMFQDSYIPNYFDALRELDLEEMVEEE
jgi:hypothetical protein